jgi:M6 family metalloprotease-like protein
MASANAATRSCKTKGSSVKEYQSGRVVCIKNDGRETLAPLGTLLNSPNFKLQYENASIGSTTPKSAGVLTSGNLEADSCKVPSPTTQGLRKGFGNQGPKGIHSQSTLQVIPIQAADALSKGNPAADYKAFFSELKDFTVKLSDGRWSYKISIPASYIKLPKALASYRMGSSDNGGEEKSPYQSKFIEAALDAAENSFEFERADMYMFVAPPKTPATLFSRISNTFDIRFKESSFIKAFSIGQSDLATGSAHHDFFHLGLAIPDHYGDEKYNGRDSAQFIGQAGEILGTDRWGNMSGTHMDWLSWDKWVAGFLDDSQVICSEIKSPSTFWIKPSAIFGVDQKVLIIPTGKHTALAVESMRSVGYNSLIPKSHMGALVYSIDLTKNDFGAGLNVIRPKTRMNSSTSYPLPGDDALRKGDSISIKGYKFTVIESGDFGDVVKVEKIS